MTDYLGLLRMDGRVALVTGGAGLIGSHIVDQLIDAGAGEIRVLDNLVRGRRENLAAALARRPITFIEADVRDPAAVRRAVQGCDYVFHQAAIRITLCAEQPRECMDVLVLGAFNVFEAAAAAGEDRLGLAFEAVGLAALHFLNRSDRLADAARAIDARVLTERLSPLIRRERIPVPDGRVRGEAYSAAFDRWVAAYCPARGHAVGALDFECDDFRKGGVVSHERNVRAVQCGHHPGRPLA